MLSSLREQTVPQLIRVDIAHFANNGRPATEEVIRTFAPHLFITGSEWGDYRAFQQRGLVRNRALKECTTEWMLFSDCDMVYHPEYFERLFDFLSRGNSQATCMFSSGRMSNPKPLADQLVNSAVTEAPAMVPSAFEQANRLPKIRKRNVGAGFSQIINVLNSPHEGYYVDPKENADWRWDSRYQKAQSDVQFRQRIGQKGGPRRALPDWFTENLIHLNHNRDNEFGVHLEEQR